MESPPDLQPEAEYAGSAATLPRPTLLRNLGFWLLAMLLGSAFLLLLPALTGSRGSKAYSISSLVASLAPLTGLSTIFSLPALPLLLPLLPWALTAPAVGLRWLRVFTLQSLSLSGFTALGYLLVGGSGPGGFGAAAFLLGTPYFGAGLLVAVVVYWPWLRRRQ